MLPNPRRGCEGVTEGGRGQLARCLATRIEGNGVERGSKGAAVFRVTDTPAFVKIGGDYGIERREVEGIV